MVFPTLTIEKQGHAGLLTSYNRHRVTTFPLHFSSVVKISDHAPLHASLTQEFRLSTIPISFLEVERIGRRSSFIAQIG